MNAAPRFVAAEGPIGVGKTTLARRLAGHMDAALLLERPQDNPFLPDFYLDPDASALPTQLYFLFQRARQMARLRQVDLFHRARVADFIMDKDPLFARITLDDEEFRLYEQVYSRLAVQAPVPDVIVYLQAPVPVLLDRIRLRGIGYEQGISAGYLERLSGAYSDYFRQYDQAPVLVVNTESLDLSAPGAPIEALARRMTTAGAGRHYLQAADLE